MGEGKRESLETLTDKCGHSSMKRSFILGSRRRLSYTEVENDLGGGVKQGKGF